MMLRDLDILNVDYTAANADYRVTETHKVANLNGRVLIPFEGPIYSRNLVVRGDGAPLSIETDYTLEDDFVQLELMTGKRVVGSIRFSSKIITDYKEIKITYQKVGDAIVSREFLVNAIKEITDSTTSIDWLTQVFGKPSSYPPATHKHDITKSDEVVGFHDLMMLFKMASGDISKNGLAIWNSLKAIEEKAFTTLNGNYTTLWNKMFTHIMNVNKPHPMTKASIGLGNHPNYATATLDEDIAAASHSYDETVNGALVLRNDVISTPAGVRDAIGSYEVDTDGYVRQGDLPFSYYGSGFYLPPEVKGAFEGIGLNLGTAAFCLESNGYVTAIARGFDSRVKGLFYYYNETFYDKIDNFIFTNVQYKHPLVEADNAKLLKEYQDSHDGSSVDYVPLQVDHVLGGSSGLVLCIGNYDRKQYYIGLGGGTLDPNAHVLKRINYEDFTDSVEGNAFDPIKSAVMLIGDYVYIVAQSDGWPTTTPESAKFGINDETYRKRIFYRANKADLLDNTTDDITFVKQKMNYQDVEGDWHYNQDTVEFVPFATGTNSSGSPYVKSFFVDFTPTPGPNFTNLSLSVYHCSFIYKEDPSDTSIGSIKILHGIEFVYPGQNKTTFFTCLPVTFDTKTNTLSVKEDWFKVTYDLVNKKAIAPSGKNLDAWYSNNVIYALSGRSAEINPAYVDGLGIVAMGTTTQVLPFLLGCYFGDNLSTKGETDQWTNFNKDLSSTSTLKTGTILTETPFSISSLPAMVQDVWFYDGVLNDTPLELFRGLNTKFLSTLFCRKTLSADYTLKEDLYSPYVGKDIYARTDSAQYYKVTVESDTLDNSSWQLPCVNYPIKNRMSSQHGLCTIQSTVTSGDYPQPLSSLYAMAISTTTSTISGRVAMDTTGGFYLDTLATYTTDSQDDTVCIKSDTTGRYWITKEFWQGLLKAGLGDDYDALTDNGLSSTIEYFLTIGLINPTQGTTFPNSYAYIVFHRNASSGAEAGRGYFRLVEFDWTATTTNSDGFKIPTLGTATLIGESYAANFTYTSTGKWPAAKIIPERYPTKAPNIQFNGTDKDNFSFYFSTGVGHPVSGDTCFPYVINQVVNGVSTKTFGFSNIGIPENMQFMYQSVMGGGLQACASSTISGGADYYTVRDDGAYTLLKSVFSGGVWTVNIANDTTAMFNGSLKTIKASDYDLSQLGIDPANKTFYLYAVSGKTQGYYDLSLSEKTASPYHLLVATIVTGTSGIETITTQTSFAISGFTITTENLGGSIPASSGVFPDTGSFDAVFKEDLFDILRYK